LKIATDEYQNVWMSPDHLVRIGPYTLNRYYDTGDGPCPEVETGAYDEQIAPWLAQANSQMALSLTPSVF
jgi:hypothetical protein